MKEMGELLDFIKAAAPWIIMGLALAVFFGRSAAKKRKSPEEKPGGDYGAEGMSMGMCFGAAMGAALKVNIATGLSLGMLAGMVLGSCVAKKEDSGE